MAEFWVTVGVQVGVAGFFYWLGFKDGQNVERDRARARTKDTGPHKADVSWRHGRY